MKTRTYFAFRIDVWDDSGDSIFEHVVGSEGFQGGGRGLLRGVPALAEGEDHLAAGRAGGEEELALKNFVRQIFRVPREPKCGAAGWDSQVRQETSSASLGPPQSPVLSGRPGLFFGPASLHPNGGP